MLPKLRSLALAITMLLVGAAGANATTVDYSLDGSTVIVTGGDNANHDIQFRLRVVGSPPVAYDEVLDTVAFTSKPADCALETPTKVVCPAHDNVKVDLGAGNDAVNFTSGGYDCFYGYELNLGDGTNRVDLSGLCGATLAAPATVTSGSGADILNAGSQGPITLNAGDGNDVLRGGLGDDVLHGGEGADRPSGGDGNDQVFGDGGADRPSGGIGNDLVDGGSGDDALDFSQDGSNDKSIGADHYVGGPGTDKLWLDGRASGVSISLNGGADDGAAGEGDNVDSDIEAFEGTAGNDVFNGSDGPDAFSGGEGNDELHGAGGADDLHGGSADDRVFGDAGNDTLQGSLGADTVDGGPGTDQIYGDVSECTYSCSSDPDTLFARDGERDAVDCGGGADRAQVDTLDVVAFCAVVDRGTTPPPPLTGSSFRATGKLSRAKGIGVSVTCPSACSFTVTLTIASKIARKVGLGRKTFTIGTVRGSVAAAGDKNVTVKLSAKARKKLKRLKNVAAKLTVAVKDASGTTTTNKAITMRR